VHVCVFLVVVVVVVVVVVMVVVLWEGLAVIARAY
jgi:hypothetical protein